MRASAPGLRGPNAGASARESAGESAGLDEDRRPARTVHPMTDPAERAAGPPVEAYGIRCLRPVFFRTKSPSPMLVATTKPLAKYG